MWDIILIIITIFGVGQRFVSPRDFFDKFGKNPTGLFAVSKVILDLIKGIYIYIIDHTKVIFEDF